MNSLPAEIVSERLLAAADLSLPYLEPRAYVNDLVGLVLDNAHDPLLGHTVYPDLFLVATPHRRSYLVNVAARSYLVHDEGYIEIVSKLLSLLHLSTRLDQEILFRFVVEQTIVSGKLQAAEMILSAAENHGLHLEGGRDGFRQTYRSLHWDMGVHSYLSSRYLDDICRQVVIGHELGHFGIRAGELLRSKVAEISRLRGKYLSPNDQSLASWYIDSEEFHADTFGFWCAVGTCLAWPEGSRRGFFTWIVGSHILVLTVMSLLEAVREITARNWFITSASMLTEIQQCLDRLRFRYRVHQAFVSQSEVVRAPSGRRRYFSRPRRLDPTIKSDYIACSEFLWDRLTESVLRIAGLIAEVFSRRISDYFNIGISPIRAMELQRDLVALMAAKNSLALVPSPTFGRTSIDRPEPGSMRLQRGRSMEIPEIDVTDFESGTILHLNGRVFRS